MTADLNVSLSLSLSLSFSCIWNAKLGIFYTCFMLSKITRTTISPLNLLVKNNFFFENLQSKCSAQYRIYWHLGMVPCCNTSFLDRYVVKHKITNIRVGSQQRAPTQLWKHSLKKFIEVLIISFVIVS